MPCRDDYAEQDTKRENVDKVNTLTRMLCTTCEVAERDSFFTQLPLTVQKWWEKHKKEDEARRKRECKHKNITIRAVNKLETSAFCNDCNSRLKAKSKFDSLNWQIIEPAKK